MKSMKKSMFVTTILMVVLLIVALSTATFAWYTANSSVKAELTLVTAASSSNASVVVDEAAATDSMHNNSSVTLTMSGAVVPMIYDGAAKPTASTTYTTFKSSFETMTIDNAGKLTAASSDTQAIGIQTVKGSSLAAQTQDYFYVTNVGGVPANFTAAVTIYTCVAVEADAGDSATGLFTDPACTTPAPASEGLLTAAGTYYKAATVANNFLRVALFVDDYYVDTWALSGYNTVQYADYSVHGALGSSPKTSLSVDENIWTALTSGTSATIKTNAAPLDTGAAKVQVLVWFEGGVMTNAYAGTTAFFKIDFGASNYVAP